MAATDGKKTWGRVAENSNKEKGNQNNKKRPIDFDYLLHRSALSSWEVVSDCVYAL